MTIYWSQFDWQSFSTLATGAMAVIAAIIIGWRQNKILESQARISERQLELADLTLRHQLFEKRYIVYNAVFDYLEYWHSHGREPRSETYQRFHSATLESKFVFRPEVHTFLMSLYFDGSALRFLDSKIEGMQQRKENHSEELAERQLKYSEMLEARSKLFEVFAPEMVLSAHTART